MSSRGSLSPQPSAAQARAANLPRCSAGRGWQLGIAPPLHLAANHTKSEGRDLRDRSLVWPCRAVKSATTIVSYPPAETAAGGCDLGGLHPQAWNTQHFERVIFPLGEQVVDCSTPHPAELFAGIVSRGCCISELGRFNLLMKVHRSTKTTHLETEI